MKKQRMIPALLVCLLLCGLTVAHAAEVQTGSGALYPAEVQTISEDGQIIKTYVLTAEQSPEEIPREDFWRGNVYYTLADLTVRPDRQTDTRAHTEAVEVPADSGDAVKAIALFQPTMEYESEDGYCGVLTLNEQSVTSKAVGYKNSSYTVSATRDYPHLSSNDLSLVPKTITENGRTLELDGVTWEAQQTSNVDYADLPDSYHATATYTAKATRSVATGYVATAEYSGTITKVVSDNLICSAIFTGIEVAPEPPPQSGLPNQRVLVVCLVFAAAILTGLVVYCFTSRRNRKPRSKH